VFLGCVQALLLWARWLTDMDAEERGAEACPGLLELGVDVGEYMNHCKRAGQRAGAPARA